MAEKLIKSFQENFNFDIITNPLITANQKLFQQHESKW